jgi:hypothetical protein
VQAVAGLALDVGRVVQPLLLLPQLLQVQRKLLTLGLQLVDSFGPEPDTADR